MKSEFTQEMLGEYSKNGLIICPFCGMQSLTYYQVPYTKDGCTYAEVECRACENKWEEKLNFVGILHEGQEFLLPPDDGSHAIGEWIKTTEAFLEKLPPTSENSAPNVMLQRCIGEALLRVFREVLIEGHNEG